MQQFLVPQFIDVENKILGPITVRQFVIMITVMGALFIFYKTLDFAAFLVASLIVLVLGAAFGFLKVNGSPFHLFVLNVLQTSMRPSLRVWGKLAENVKEQESADADSVTGAVPQVVKSNVKTVNSSRLSELSMIVNTGGYYKGENS